MIRVIFAILAFAATLFSQQFVPPAVNRVKITIDTTWKFYRGDATNAHTASFNDASWTTVHLPHSAQYLSNLGNTSVYRGIAWYRKHIRLGPAFIGRRVTLFFEGAGTVAQVWINGNALATHYGSYNPFCHDITPYCTFDNSDIVIAVRLDNTYQNQVPPEKPDNSGLDYCIFGGIYRDVYLIITDSVYIPEAVHDWENGFADQGGQFITYSNVSAAAATIKVDSWIKNSGAAAAACKLVTSLVDASNTVVQSAEISGSAAAGGITKFTLSMTLSSPRLWFPYDIPYRYTLYTVVYNGAAAVDLYYTKIGIRQITWTQKDGFFCNGERIQILGLNRTQQWPYVGSAVPNIQQVRDAVVLKEAGCNFVRCSHYLQDDAFLNACDSLGMLVWLEVPSWSSGFTPLVTHLPWRTRVQEAVRSNARHARNRPCVAVWGGVNEAWQNVTFDDTLQVTFHEEDTTRPSSQSRNYSTTNNVYDLYGGNWFTDVPASNPDPRTRGFLIAEHTGHTYPTARTDPETTLVNHAMKHEQMTRWTREKTWIHGNVGWCAFDYNSGDGAALQNHGVMDIMHIPKFCYYFYKSQSAADKYDGTKHPMVFIENHYLSGSPLNRKVFTNGDSVRLYRNDTYIATLVPDKSGNALAHPPVTFSNVAFVSGSLRAEAYFKGSVGASDTVFTPGAASRILLQADPDAIEANGADFSRVVARIVDANGSVIPTATSSITFSLSGAGTLIGKNPVNAIGGYHIILAQAKLTTGMLTVSATSGSLTSNQAVIAVRPMTAIEDWTGIGKGSVNTTVFSAHLRNVERTFGNLIKLPGEINTLAVYDLQGRCLFSGLTKNNRFDLRKHGIMAKSVYLIRFAD
jgi:beta-galactosidase